MSLYRYLSTSIKSTNINSQTPPLSSIVKQLSKFSSQDKLVEYAQRTIQYCYPYRMIDVYSKRTSVPIDLIQTASDLHDQLLVRLAHCLCYFQAIPFLPGANPTLLSVHEGYLRSFEKLIKFPQIKSMKEEDKFFELINQFLSQNNDVIGLLSTGCNEAQKYFKSYETLKNFLDNVLKIRLSMRLLAEHYIEVHTQQAKNDPNGDDWYGAIAMKFSPAKAVQQCIDDVSAICFETYAVVPHVQIENHIHEQFPYFPSIVEYILRELLKNSMRAVVEYSKASLGNIQHVKKYLEDNRDKPLCKVVISSDPVDEHFTIAVKDEGGGIDATDDEIFRYMFTGDTKKVNGVNEEKEEDFDILSDFQDRMIQSSKRMYGFGFGLPICRLYAEYFSGSLSLQQVSNIGVDAYLRLGFIHTASKRIKI